MATNVSVVSVTSTVAQTSMIRLFLTLSPTHRVNGPYRVFLGQTITCYIPKCTVQRRLSGTIAILQSAQIFKASCWLKVHNAHFKLASPISE